MQNNMLKTGAKKIWEHHSKPNSSEIHKAKHFYKSENTYCRYPKQYEKNFKKLEFLLQKPQRARKLIGGNVYKTIKYRSIFDTFNISC